jgi:hypothetical protein
MKMTNEHHCQKGQEKDSSDSDANTTITTSTAVLALQINRRRSQVTAHHQQYRLPPYF